MGLCIDALISSVVSSPLSGGTKTQKRERKCPVGAETVWPIDAVGDTFVMAVHNEERGAYRIENHAAAFALARVIA